MVHRLSVLILGIVIISSCSGKLQEDKAAIAAKDYYEMLISGQYENFVAGSINTNNIPKEYRSQLVTNAKQFVAVQKKERGGIRGVKIVNSIYNKKKNSADVLLVLCYKDSANEEIVVPMIQKNGKWMMR